MGVVILLVGAAVLGWLADTAPDVFTALTQGGAIAVLAMAVIAYTNEWVVSGRTHRRALADKDAQIAKWMDLADRWSKAASSATHGLEVVAEPARELGDKELIKEARARGLVR